MQALIDHARVCAVVLAGGQGSRMGGVDKGLQTYRGTPLVAHALERLRHQSGGAPGMLAINANRNLDHYASWCPQVWPDTVPGYPGPLAGFLTALQRSGNDTHSFDFVLTVPCDSPLFPLDLLQRLASALASARSDLAMAQAPEPNDTGVSILRNQPVFCLMRTSLLTSLKNFMEGDQRKIGAWALAQNHVMVPFDGPTDPSNAFYNTNTLDQLHRLEQE